MVCDAGIERSVMNVEIIDVTRWFGRAEAVAGCEPGGRAIERVDLGGEAGAELGTLSGGRLRRAGIGQAIVSQPELLLDDLTAGPDLEQRMAFRELLGDPGRRSAVVMPADLVEDGAPRAARSR
jgi:ABC-type Mn2+/Zn2+ transport system ATPase subunit